MERVQWNQEQMLAELKDLVSKRLFSQSEVKQIIKKRTAFEAALVRRIARKADFLRYAAYEMGLEALRRKRIQRLNLPPSPPSVSDYALVRRQFQIFERAIRKFKADIGLWIQYIEVAKRENALTLVGRLCARSIQTHPASTALYVLAASHELSQSSPTAARTLLQRGIRLNPESMELWVEYVKMELSWVETLRRRWEVLGLESTTTEAAIDAHKDGFDLLPDDNYQAEQSRTRIMEGMIVKIVMENAVKAIPVLNTFTSIHRLLRFHPCPICPSLVAHLLSLLRTTRPDDPNAILFCATHSLDLNDDLILTPALVDTLKQANQELLTAAIRLGKEMSKAYAQFVRTWFERMQNDSLRLYLVSSLQNLIKRSPKGTLSPTTFSVHLRLLSPDPPEKLLRIARKYTDEAEDDVDVWLARLDIEERLGPVSELDRVWSMARKLCRGDRCEEIWVWGLGSEANDELYQRLLLESLRQPSLTLHSRLLKMYITYVYSQQPAQDVRMDTIRRICSLYLPDSSFFQFAFELEAGSQLIGSASSNSATLPPADAGTKPLRGILQMIFTTWRNLEDADSISSASLTWATWLVRNGDPGLANQIIGNALKSLEGRAMNQAETVQLKLPERWRAVLDARVVPDSEDQDGL